MIMLLLKRKEKIDEFIRKDKQESRTEWERERASERDKEYELD